MDEARATFDRDVIIKKGIDVVAAVTAILRYEQDVKRLELYTNMRLGYNQPGGFVWVDGTNPDRYEVQADDGPAGDE